MTNKAQQSQVHVLQYILLHIDKCGTKRVHTFADIIYTLKHPLNIKIALTIIVFDINICCIGC